jgi:hypothetical protein
MLPFHVRTKDVDERFFIVLHWLHHLPSSQTIRLEQIVVFELGDRSTLSQCMGWRNPDCHKDPDSIFAGPARQRNVPPWALCEERGEGAQMADKFLANAPRRD